MRLRLPICFEKSFPRRFALGNLHDEYDYDHVDDADDHDFDHYDDNYDDDNTT